ncbi:MAG: T9SS type A sorting domain-containing protein, partial [Ignavibacteriae bacterium]|nr:T9SS type A sorting domain-containing protein [Ignavibacteriota bacterium]
GTAPVNSRARLFATTNGGTNWTNITGSLPDRYPVDLQVDAAEPGTVYVVFSGYGTPHVFRSSDFGQTWADIGATLPDVPTSALVIDPLRSRTIYVGNDIGVFVSTNTGASWSAFQSGLPEAVIVMDLAISTRNRMLRVATHGNGVYERRLLDEPTRVGQADEPAQFALEQNYPNPFNSAATIRYTLIPVLSPSGRGEKGVRVSLKVYDLVGSEVATLVNEVKEPGEHQVQFDASGLASGVYLYRLEAGNLVQTKKALLVR